MSRGSRRESKDFNTKRGEEERREPTKMDGWGEAKRVGEWKRLGSSEMKYE
jgi:hypothetical protein